LVARNFAPTCPAAWWNLAIADLWLRGRKTQHRQCAGFQRVLGAPCVQRLPVRLQWCCKIAERGIDNVGWKMSGGNCARAHAVRIQWCGTIAGRGIRNVRPAGIAQVASGCWALHVSSGLPDTMHRGCPPFQCRVHNVRMQWCCGVAERCSDNARPSNVAFHMSVDNVRPSNVGLKM
jgi:hypothetical protein